MAEFGTELFHQMPLIEYRQGKWSDIRWQTSSEISLSPAAHCLHYGSTCFEGAKAFLHDNGDKVIFRIDDHIERMCHTAEGLYLPVPDKVKFKQMIVELVQRAADVMPAFPGALYIRPLLIGLDPKIGNATHPPHDAYLFVLGSPVGDYFTPGTELKVYVDESNLRCAPHMGMLKTGGNYASALPWAMRAEQKWNAQQVLFCPNGDVQETGAANFMLIDPKEKRLITKNLTPEFLHGITRDSILKVAADMGYTIDERAYTTKELREFIKQGVEASLSGTAAVMAPVTSFLFEDGVEIPVASQEKALELREALLAIQSGQNEDRYGWLTKV